MAANDHMKYIPPLANGHKCDCDDSCQTNDCACQRWGFQCGVDCTCRPRSATALDFCRSKFANLHRLFGVDEMKRIEGHEWNFKCPLTWARASACFTHHVQSDWFSDPYAQDGLGDALCADSEAFKIDTRLIAYEKSAKHIPEGTVQWTANWRTLMRHGLGVYPDIYTRENTYWPDTHFYSLRQNKWLKVHDWRHCWKCGKCRRAMQLQDIDDETAIDVRAGYALCARCFKPWLRRYEHSLYPDSPYEYCDYDPVSTAWLDPEDLEDTDEEPLHSERTALSSDLALHRPKRYMSEVEAGSGSGRLVKRRPGDASEDKQEHESADGIPIVRTHERVMGWFAGMPRTPPNHIFPPGMYGAGAFIPTRSSVPSTNDIEPANTEDSVHENSPSTGLDCTDQDQRGPPIGLLPDQCSCKCKKGCATKNCLCHRYGEGCGIMCVCQMDKGNAGVQACRNPKSPGIMAYTHECFDHFHSVMSVSNDTRQLCVKIDDAIAEAYARRSYAIPNIISDWPAWVHSVQSRDNTLSRHRRENTWKIYKEALGSNSQCEKMSMVFFSFCTKRWEDLRLVGHCRICQRCSEVNQGWHCDTCVSHCPEGVKVCGAACPGHVVACEDRSLRRGT